MDKEHFILFMIDVFENKEKHLRLGQTIMVVLYKHNRFIYDKLTESKIDCFYDDTKVISVLNYLLQLPEPEGDGLSGILGKAFGS